MQKTQKKNTNGNGSGSLQMILLSSIELLPGNPRQAGDPKKFAELVSSIKQTGVLQPILVRKIKPETSSKAKFQLIAGERRVRASEKLGLKEIPAQIKTMTEAEALSARIVENLQREDIHPLDEAEGFLRFKEEMKLDIRGIANRVGKDARYVARRLALTNLIAEAKEDFRKERLTLGHALELSRLAPEIQAEALAACYESKPVPKKQGEGYTYKPDKTRPAKSVQYLQGWLSQNVHLNLQNAPFKLDDSRLREDGLTCLNCPQRSGHNKLLFADIKSSDTCLNPLCFQGKLQKLIQLTQANIAEKQGKPAKLISSYYGARASEEKVLGKDKYQLLQNKADRCEFAEQAVVMDGSDIGKAKWICAEASCKDHLGKVRKATRTYSSNGSHATQPENRAPRKQELFNIKVDEIVRKRVLGEAIKTFSWPLERKHLDEIAKEFFRRIPADDQRTILEVLGLGEKEAEKMRFNPEGMLKRLSAFHEHQLAQFLVLCSVAHLGANPGKHRQVDESEIVALSKDRQVNHTLIDAEVRLALCAKRYKEAHQAYLESVRKNEPAPKPVVYEQSKAQA